MTPCQTEPLSPPFSPVNRGRRGKNPAVGESVTAQTDPLVAELARKLVETLGLDVAAESVDPAAPLIGAGLGIDSIDTLELVVLIEKDYGVKIDNRASGVEAF